MWHQLLDKPDSYEETSCTAIFTLAIARAVRKGWLPKAFKTYAVKGWNAVAQHISKDGVVTGICRGTEIGDSEQFYRDRKTIDNDPRGLGAVMMAGIEMTNLN
jgi:rhamnogalacturonyl hydrolase YesR